MSQADEKTYILVAHNSISRVVESYFHEMTNEEYASFGVEWTIIMIKKYFHGKELLRGYLMALFPVVEIRYIK